MSGVYATFNNRKYSNTYSVKTSISFRKMYSHANHNYTSFKTKIKNIAKKTISPVPLKNYFKRNIALKFKLQGL